MSARNQDRIYNPTTTPLVESLRSFSLLLRCELQDLPIWNTRDEGEAIEYGEQLKLSDGKVTQAIEVFGDPGAFCNVSLVTFESGRATSVRVLKEFGASK